LSFSLSLSFFYFSLFLFFFFSFCYFFSLQLLQAMWSGKYSVCTPSEFKAVIGEFKPEFAGYQQHDSHEFLGFLLDGLHEDLNRVLKKPYTEEKDSNNRPDAVVSAEMWRDFLARNDSELVDHCFGQIRSDTICQSCGRESVKFEAVSSLQLAIPSSGNKVIKFIMVTLPLGTRAKWSSLRLSFDARVRDFKAQVARLRQSQLQPGQLVQYHVCSMYHRSRRIFKTCQDNDLVCELGRLDELIVFELEGKALEEESMLAEAVADVNGPAVARASTNGYPSTNGHPMGVPAAAAAVAHALPVSHSTQGSVSVQGTLSFVPGATTVVNAQPLLSHVDIIMAEVGAAAGAATFSSGYSQLRPVPGPTTALAQNLPTLDLAFAVFATPARIAVSTATPLSQIHRMVWLVARQLCKSSFGRADGEGKDEGLPKEALPYTLCIGRGTTSEVRGRLPDTDELTLADLLLGTAEDFRPCEEAVQGDGAALRRAEWPLCQRMEQNDPLLCMWDRQSDSVDLERCQPVDLRLQDQTAPDKAVTLEDCLDFLTQQEELDKSESYYCSKCKTHVSALKNFDLWAVPDVLIISLKRFKDVQGSYFVHREKITNLVQFPVDTLDLSRFVKGPTTTDAPPIYTLAGVSEHIGGLGGGHYTAKCKNFQSGRWFSFDDSRVSETTASQVVTPEAYALFYVRNKGSLRWGGLQR
jgi:ubiquitin C-terminal hydrolase